MVDKINEVPLLYLIKRGLSPQQVEAVRTALSMTPCHAVFISRIEDHDLAWRFGDQVIRSDSDEAAFDLAKVWAERIGRPMLVLGGTELLAAVYSDGRRETMEVHAAS